MKPLPGSFANRKKEIAEELESHLRMATQELIDRGMKRDEARACALKEFGNLPLVGDVATEMWGWLWLDRLLQDLRYAVRQVWRSPGFAATVIGTLALGIGAATAMFTVVAHSLITIQAGWLLFRSTGRKTSAGPALPGSTFSSGWHEAARSAKLRSSTAWRGAIFSKRAMAAECKSTQRWSVPICLPRLA